MVEKNEEKGETLDVLPFDTDEKVPASYVPEGFDTVEDFLADMREEYELDLAADHDNRLEALDDKQFAAGEQWDPEVRQNRAGLPCLTINTVPQFIAQLVGDWRLSKNGIRVLPAEGVISKSQVFVRILSEPSSSRLVQIESITTPLRVFVSVAMAHSV